MKPALPIKVRFYLRVAALKVAAEASFLRAGLLLLEIWLIAEFFLFLPTEITMLVILTPIAVQALVLFVGLVNDGVYSRRTLQRWSADGEDPRLLALRALRSAGEDEDRWSLKFNTEKFPVRGPSGVSCLDPGIRLPTTLIQTPSAPVSDAAKLRGVATPRRRPA